MAWCEANEVRYVLVLSRNKRLNALLGAQMEAARQAYERTGKVARRFRDFRYRTRNNHRSIPTFFLSGSRYCRK